ncbi:hypothetical protein C7441_101390 [Pseudaminobacter salicylatoxidans]|uniref:Uncharacterized protein n=1 Tax=Pseudaminobacter salicylatoxidans TaxID=93369 RepID=A0A316C9P0_PSESE|nr:hypothetical protein C7441_101390 [Pseudaminobacter salicylatoxidans]
MAAAQDSVLVGNATVRLNTIDDKPMRKMFR